MAYRKPALLDEKHDLSGFECGRDTLDAWLRERAHYNQSHQFTRTFVIANEKHLVVAYYSLCAGMIHRRDVTRSISGGQAPADIPVALLARLAVDRRHQGSGLGGELLRHALVSAAAAARTVAFRAVMVDALDESAAAFYLKYGFRNSRISPSKLLLPLKDIIASFEEAERDPQ